MTRPKWKKLKTSRVGNELFLPEVFSKDACIYTTYLSFLLFSVFFFVNDIIIVWALIMLIIEFAFWYHLSFKIYDDDFNVSGIRSFFFLQVWNLTKHFTVTNLNYTSFIYFFGGDNLEID